MARTNRQALASWLFLGLLTAGALVLGFLQYHWLGEVSAAERERLRTTLQGGLVRVAEEFDARIATVSSAVAPGPGISDATDRERAWAEGFAKSKHAANGAIVRGLYLARPVNDGIALRRLDPNSAAFSDADWPADLAEVRERLLQRINGTLRGPVGLVADAVVEAPYFGAAENGPRAPVEWGLIELDRDYLASKLVPALLERQLGPTALQEYDFRVTARNDEDRVIYASADSARAAFEHPDAAVDFFQARPLGRFAGPPDERRFEPEGPRPPGFEGPGWRGGEPRRTPGSEFRNGGPGKRERGRFGPGPRGRWLLEARSRAGSLESFVEKARMRNLFVITALLGFIVAAGIALVRFARRAHQLADMQIEFVAGVSHELRTPLAVMRTAGYNLARTPAADPERVQQYGALIQSEAEKLSKIVEEVLGFSKAQAGRAIGPVAPVSVESLIDQAIVDSHIAAERDIQPGLPAVLADEHALKHALQNLLSNASKYGDGWIGLKARAVPKRVEISVSDKGPGIPADELSRIFEPFYRGRQAVADQIHGTGLGLSLVKRIVDAHHGTISVRSKEGNGSEFVVAIPAAESKDSAG